MQMATRMMGALGLALVLGQSAFAGGNDAVPVVPTALAVPAGFEVQAHFFASGVQIYRCLPSVANPALPAWSFIAPEATLFRRSGKIAGHHFAGPTWQATDGSKVVGTVLARVPSSQAGTIPWLLLSAVVVQQGETFENVAYVQRLNTDGGAAPAAGCTIDVIAAEVRVPYTADYYFYSAD
jgi:hypothetical protein